LRDAELRRRFAESARRQIQSAHNWENSMKVLDEVVNRAAVPV
jgi:hypothetical protein